MSDSKLYVIELDGDGGDVTTIRRLVRCRDCKFFEPMDDMRPSWCWRDSDHAGHGWPTSENRFCSWAEKMKDGGSDA